MGGEGERKRGHRRRLRVRSEEAATRACEGGRSCDGSQRTTTLISAAQGRGNLDVVKYLIDKHADPNKANDHGMTPLHAAAVQGYYEIAEYLLMKGATVDPISQDGETPLHIAAHNGHARTVTLLLEHNADCNKLSDLRRTPLMESIYGCSLECLDILFKAGADVNPSDCHVAPVTLAASKGLDDCIEFLLKNGADANVPDKAGKLPIEIAAAKGYEKCVTNLLPYATPLAKYEGLSSAGIVEWEISQINERLHRAARASAEGDTAYWAKDYGSAVAHYTEALEVGRQNDNLDPALYAKRSLSHLHLRDDGKFMEDAIAYNYALAILGSQPELLKATSQNDARRLVMGYAKQWKGNTSTQK